MDLGALVIVCIAAFAAVFVLLSLLAAIMRLILAAFPQIDRQVADAAVIAAVSTVVTNLYPRTRITKIEEIE
jgi:hypothetical protein